MRKLIWRDWLSLSVIIVFLAMLSAFTPVQWEKNGTETSSFSPEIQNIKALKNTNEQSKELLALIERVGPEQAQEEMFRSGLPFTGETHLLIHTIGDYLYERYGLEGLPYCRDYFLSACYHGFIINTLSGHGMDGVAQALEKCNQSGGPVAAQCAHASGHGFAAWHDYDLVEALKMCDELGAELERFGYFNCYDGVFMENVWGVHNGAPSPKRWVKESDIYYPCTDPRIPEKYLDGCWSNQATLLYQRYGGDLLKTAKACDAVENDAYKEICYNNFARQIHPLTRGEKDKVFSLCANATGARWNNYCVLTNMSAAWSVGDRLMPFEVCADSEGSLREHCLERLTSLIMYYYPRDSKDRALYCDKILSEAHRDRCKK